MPAEATAAAARLPARFEDWFGRLLQGGAVPADPALRRAVRIHANNAMVAACDALASNFPVLRAMLGEAGFAVLARRHVLAQPPADPRLCLYGQTLADSVAASLDLAEWPWLPDMARLEWQVVAALFAAAPPARPRRLAAARSWPLAPATRWLPSNWPIASLWQAHQPGADWPAAFPGHGEVALITRRGAGIRVGALPADALPLLLALHRRDPLGSLDAGQLAHLPALAAAGALVPAVGDGQ